MKMMGIKDKTEVGLVVDEVWGMEDYGIIRP
jgi:hypothetical protein